MNREWLDDEIEAEYKKSLEIYPVCNIPHGSLGVILEEVTEAVDEINNINDKLVMLQKVVYESKGYPHKMCEEEYRLLNGIILDTVHLVEECIQVAAMCRKYQRSYERE